jgi:hypothetical protein
MLLKERYEEEVMGRQGRRGKQVLESLKERKISVN